jgi:predicted NUDIX family NTP pyrophosphohydrolase
MFECLPVDEFIKKNLRIKEIPEIDEASWFRFD